MTVSELKAILNNVNDEDLEVQSDYSDINGFYTDIRGGEECLVLSRLKVQPR